MRFARCAVPSTGNSAVQGRAVVGRSVALARLWRRGSRHRASLEEGI